MFNENEYKIKSYYAAATYAAIFKVRPQFPELEILADSTLVRVSSASEVLRLGPVEYASANLNAHVLLYFNRTDAEKILPERRGDALLGALSTAIREEITEDSEFYETSFAVSYGSPKPVSLNFKFN